MNHNAESEMYRKYLELTKLLNIYLNHFPSHEKFGLSTKIRDTTYSMFGFFTEAQKRFHNKTALTNLDVAHEQLRMYILLAYELGYLGYKDGRTSEDPKTLGRERFGSITRLVDEFGRMIGGWRAKVFSNKQEES